MVGVHEVEVGAVDVNSRVRIVREGGPGPVGVEPAAVVGLGVVGVRDLKGGGRPASSVNPFGRNPCLAWWNS